MKFLLFILTVVLFLHRSKTKEYSDDSKSCVISYKKNGKSHTQVPKDFGLSRQIINIWNIKAMNKDYN